MSALPPVVVFGGGLLGSAVARLAAGKGHPVLVASRTERVHPGWWRHFSVGSDAPLGWMPGGAHVVLALGPREGEKPHVAWGSALPALVGRLRSLRPLSVRVAGPAAVGGGGLERFDLTAAELIRAGATVVRVSAMVGLGDRWAGPLAVALRSGGSPRVSTALPPSRCLVVDDVARALLAERLEGDQLLTGERTWTAAELLSALERRFGAQARGRLFGVGLHADTLARLTAQAALPDSWDDDRFGPRTPLSTWIERLPGPRRRSASD